MKILYFVVFFAHLFVYAAIYSVHNYITAILKYKSNLSNNEVSFLNLFDIFRLISAYGFGRFADKYRCRYLVGLFSIIMYLFVLYYITFCLKVTDSYVKTVVFALLLKGFNTGVVPMIEVMSINIAINRHKWLYSILRLSLIFGRSLGHFIPTLLYKTTINARFYCTLIFTCISTPLLLILHFKTREIENQIEDTKLTEKTTSKIFSGSYFLILIFVTLQGIHRTALTTFQTIFMEKISSFDVKSVSYVYIFRTIPEIIVDLCCPLIEDTFDIYFLVFFGGLFGGLRALTFGFVNQKCTFLFYVSEIPKAIFSCFICYGMTKITKLYHPMERVATAQSIYNGCYNGLAPFIGGLIGYWYLKNESLDNLRGFFILTAGISFLGLGLFFFIKKRKFK